jgi:hypothetical protein
MNIERELWDRLKPYGKTIDDVFRELKFEIDSLKKDKTDLKSYIQEQIENLEQDIVICKRCGVGYDSPNVALHIYKNILNKMDSDTK